MEKCLLRFKGTRQRLCIPNSKEQYSITYNELVIGIDPMMEYTYDSKEVTMLYVFPFNLYMEGSGVFSGKYFKDYLSMMSTKDLDLEYPKEVPLYSLSAKYKGMVVGKLKNVDGKTVVESFLEKRSPRKIRGFTGDNPRSYTVEVAIPINPGPPQVVARPGRWDDPNILDDPNIFGDAPEPPRAPAPNPNLRGQREPRPLVQRVGGDGGGLWAAPGGGGQYLQQARAVPAGGRGLPGGVPRPDQQLGEGDIMFQRAYDDAV